MDLTNTKPSIYRDGNVRDFVTKYLLECVDAGMTNENCSLFIGYPINKLDSMEAILALRNIPVLLTIVDEERVTTTTKGRISWIGEAMDIWIAIRNEDYQRAVSIVKRLDNRMQTLLGIKFREMLFEDFELLGGLVDFAKLQNGEKVDGMGYTTGAETIENISKRLLEILNASRKSLASSREVFAFK